jgi:hypothetical protein
MMVALAWVMALTLGPVLLTIMVRWLAATVRTADRIDPPGAFVPKD